MHRRVGADRLDGENRCRNGWPKCKLGRDRTAGRRGRNWRERRNGAHRECCGAAHCRPHHAADLRGNHAAGYAKIARPFNDGAGDRREWTVASLKVRDPGREHAGADTCLFLAYPQECSDDYRVEVGPGASNQFGPSVVHRHCLLIGPGRGHDFERVGDGDDARTDGELVACQPGRVTRSVHTFVVFPRTSDPFTQPRLNTGETRATCSGMRLENRPFLVGRLAVLVENFRGHSEFADVVEHCAPAQTFTVDFGKPKFLANDVGKGSYAFGMSPRPTVVLIELSNKYEYLFSGDLGVA